MKHMRLRLVLWTVLIVFVSSVLATALVALIGGSFAEGAWRPVLPFSLALRSILTPIFSVAIAMGILATSSRKMVAPMAELTRATREIAAGNFDVRVSEWPRQDEIGQLARDFNLMARELKSNEYLRKDFVSNVSHEFKTPLAIIHGYAKLLENEALSPEERREYALTIRKESERLLTLSSNILRLSKLDNQFIQDPPLRFSLDEQLRQVIVFLEPQWGAKEIVFDVDLPPVPYLGNEDLLLQVWMNLIGNAIKFSKTGGAIGVRMRQTEGGVEVCVEDHGIGMDADTLPHIFEQFYQGDSSHAENGNGLGLAIVKKILDTHGGHIAVKSAPGQGAAFTVFLPVKEA